MLPRKIIFDAIGFSVDALQTITAKVKNLADTSRHQLLIPDDENGLADALFAYETFLTEQPLSGRCKAVRLALKEYYNAWSFLFDAAQSGSRTIAEPTKAARTAQKACHTRLVEILECGNGNGQEEFDAFVEALRELSEAMGENIESVKRQVSLTGKKYLTFKIPATRAAVILDLTPREVRKIAKTNQSLRIALNADTEEPLIAWRDANKKILKEIRAARKEVREIKRARPLSSVDAKAKVKHGFI